MRSLRFYVMPTPLESLVADGSFHRAGSIDGEVPNGFSVYAVRLREGSSLPEPCESHLALGRSCSYTKARRPLCPSACSANEESLRIVQSPVAQWTPNGPRRC